MPYFRTSILKPFTSFWTTVKESSTWTLTVGKKRSCSREAFGASFIHIRTFRHENILKIMWNTAYSLNKFEFKKLWLVLICRYQSHNFLFESCWGLRLYASNNIPYDCIGWQWFTGLSKNSKKPLLSAHELSGGKC